MLSLVGTGLISLSVFVNLIAVVLLIISILKQEHQWQKRGQRAFVFSTALLLLSLVILLFSLIANRFELRYVLLNSNRSLPLHYKITAIWAGQEGSLLLWSFIQVLLTTIIVKNIKKEDRLSLFSSVILGLISISFTTLTLFFSNPFVKSGVIASDGLGMNPLLRHPAMVFHPPFLYVGFVGLSIPFAFAVGSLITNKVDDWPKKIRQWIILSWVALSIGIILGAKWAYSVLGWGGYWGWDPVENAGLMPWLTATGLLHGFSLQRKSKGFKVWNITLAVMSFALVVLGTFITRSGIIQSVHAFARAQIGLYFLIMIGLIVFGSLLLMIIFRKSFGEINYPERILSMEGISFFTLILLVLITLSILSGTLLPALTNGRFSAPPAWFNRVIGPQLGALVFLMGVCPLLGNYGKYIKGSLWKGLFPVLGLILMIIAAFLLGFTKSAAMIGFALAGLAGGVAVGEVVFITEKRLKLSKDQIQKKPLQITEIFAFGGQLIHLGIVMIAIGVIGTQMYTTSENISLKPNESATVGNFTLVYEQLDQEFVKDRFESRASIAVLEESTHLVTVKPQLVYYEDYEQTIADPAIFTRILEDVYIVFFQYDPSGMANFSVRINPLSSFLWSGSLVLILGGFLSLLPRISSTQPKLSKQKRNLRIGLMMLIFVMLISVLWAENFNFMNKSSRPQQGQKAPIFESSNLDNEIINLKDYQGQIVILHFWGTWCAQCEDELLIFEKVWKEEKQGDVVILGVAVNDTKSALNDFLSDLNLSYEIIPDPEGIISKLYGVTAVPETFVLNSEGKVEKIYIGVINEKTLTADLQDLLN